MLRGGLSWFMIRGDWNRDREWVRGRQMLPEQFTERMKRMLGEEFQPFYDSYQKPCRRALRLNPFKADRAAFLEDAPFSLRPVPWEENGFC